MTFFNANGVVIPCSDELADQVKKDYGIKKAGVTITDEEWEAAGGLARIIGGKIVIGKTETEKKAEANAKRVCEIDRQLDVLDIASVRAVRALLAGTATDSDAEKLKSIEAQTEALRAERKTLIA